LSGNQILDDFYKSISYCHCDNELLFIAATTNISSHLNNAGISYQQ